MMKEELKIIWKNTFGDPDSYIEFFFTHIFKEENVLFQTQQGRIVSALHLVPYQMTWQGEIVPVSYICGVATIPEERGKGRMASLMEEAHRVSKNRGDAFTVLIPANPGLFTYYRNMGYSELFYYETYEYRQKLFTDDPCYKLTSAKDIPTRQLFDFFYAGLIEREICILHPWNDFLLILQEMHLSGGELKVLTHEANGIEAIAFLYPSAEKENHFIIKDLVYTCEEMKELLLYKISLTSASPGLTVRQPVKHGTPVAFGMAYPIHTPSIRLDDNQYGSMSLMLE